MYYVPVVARRYLGCGLAYDEMVAAGNLGLVEAAIRFDETRGVKFVTYADWWIRKSVLKTIQEQSGPVRLPRYRQEQLRELHDARSRYRGHHGREPSADDLASLTGRSATEIVRLLGIVRRGVSIEQPVSPADDLPLSSTLADDEVVAAGGLRVGACRPGHWVQPVPRALSRVSPGGGVG